MRLVHFKELFFVEGKGLRIESFGGLEFLTFLGRLLDFSVNYLRNERNDLGCFLNDNNLFKKRKKWPQLFLFLCHQFSNFSITQIPNVVLLYLVLAYHAQISCNILKSNCTPVTAQFTKLLYSFLSKTVGLSE